MLFVWLSNRNNWPLVIWFLLSVIMIVIPSQFWINDFINHPQHEQFKFFNEISRIIKDPEYLTNKFWYWAFFAVDFFWAFLTLTIVGKLINDNWDDKNKKDSSIWDLFKFKGLPTTLKVYVVIAAFAYLFDVVEGILYTTFSGELLETIAGAKKIGYVLCALFLIYYLFKNFVYPNFRSFLRFLWASLLSILFISVIYLLLTLMPQGGTLVVDLFYKPWNIIIFFFLLMFLAILLSHYPVYMDIWTYDKNKEIDFKMSKGPNVLGLGIIYHDTSGAMRNGDYNDDVAKGLRRSLGIFLYVAVFNIIYMVIDRFYEVHINPLTATLFVLAIALFIYYLEGKTYSFWMKCLNRVEIAESTLNKNIGYAVDYVSWFPWYFLLTILFTFLTAYVVYLCEWSIVSVLFFMITLGFQLFLYVMFRISRSLLKYVFGSEKLYLDKPQIFNPLLYTRFSDYFEANPQKKPFNPLNVFAHLSDNVVYIKLMRLSGFVSFLVIVAANIWVEVATFLNPIVVILFYIILFYSFIVIVFKHILYYSRKINDSKIGRYFKYLVPVAAILLVGLASYLSGKPNDLHELTLVERKIDFSAKEYFEKSIDTNVTTKKNYFFVGSYGGGLKANLWNLLLLHELDETYGDEFFPRTLVLSGVSGGAVGIGNYTSLLHNSDSVKNFDKQIFEVGKSNVLSNELVLLLGKDWFKEYLPSNKYDGRDRSYYSMQTHAENTKMANYNTVSLEDYWYTAYLQRDERFPIMVMNTTSVGGNQGIASSVQFPKNTFPAATVINQFEDRKKSLTFYGAVSTTNRFPIFSPTAKIKDKGAFIDGGYFENSGLLSAMQVYDAIVSDSTMGNGDKIQPIFINIINSKDFYVKQKLKEYKLEPNYQNDPSEYQSIIETITSTNILPNYILEKLRSRGFALELLMMPHKISLEDVQSSIRGEVKDPMSVMDILQLHNDSINDALRRYEPYDLENWGVVEPPLARLLSEPAIYYQKAMVKKHPLIREKIDYIMRKYIKSKRPVDAKVQDSLKQARYTTSILD